MFLVRVMIFNVRVILLLIVKIEILLFNQIVLVNSILVSLHKCAFLHVLFAS